VTTETSIANSKNQKNNNNTSINPNQPHQAVPQHGPFPFYGNYVFIKTNAELFSDKSKTLVTLDISSYAISIFE